MNRQEVETFVALRYGEPQATYEYIASLPLDVYHAVTKIIGGAGRFGDRGSATILELAATIDDDRALLEKGLLLQCIHRMLINYHMNQEDYEQNRTNRIHKSTAW